MSSGEIGFILEPRVMTSVGLSGLILGIGRTWVDSVHGSRVILHMIKINRLPGIDTIDICRS